MTGSRASKPITINGAATITWTNPSPLVPHPWDHWPTPAEACGASILLDTMGCDLPASHEGPHVIEGMSGGPIRWSQHDCPTCGQAVREFEEPA